MSLRIPRELSLHQLQDEQGAAPSEERTPITLAAFRNFWALISLLIAALVMLLLIALVRIY